MSEENINQKCRLKKNETRNYFIREINQNELMGEKNKKVCRVLNYIEHLLILTSTVPGCLFISYFASTVRIPIGITSSAIGLNLCVTPVGIRQYKSIIKKFKKERSMIK